MKNYYIIIVLIAQFWSVALFAQVTTPNGTQVDYKIYSEGDVALLENQAAQWLSDRGWTDSVSRIGPATAKYNCHSYTWYKKEGGSNDYWINAFLNLDFDVFNRYSYFSTPPAPDNINKYWNDYSYTEVDVVEATKVWFGSCWQWTGYEWSNYCDHSAVKLATGLYESKWGAWPLYRHPADKCPYSLANREYFKRSPYLSGPSLICSSGGSFTVNNLPTGATITWSQGPNLARTSAQGANPCIFSSTGSGSSWVRATLVTSCGSVTLPDKVVWSGTPVISYISGPTYTPNNQWATYYAMPNNPAMGVTDYNWILNPLNGNSVYDYGWTADIAFYNSGFYQVVSRGQNTCGWGDYTVTGIEVYDSKGMSIYPNPASGEVTIEIQSSGDKELTATVWELEIYTPGMILKEKKTSLKDNKTIINTSGWQEGIYMLRVKHGESLLTGKLIIKR